MTVNEITAVANNYTDENFNSSVTLDYVNSGLSQINLYLKSKLPLTEDVTAEYEALDDTWLMSTVVPYVCWSIKMNDGSLNEASMFFAQYSRALEELKRNKKNAIAKEYQGDGFKQAVRIKPYKNQWGQNAYGRGRAHSNNPLAQEEDE